MCEPTTLVAMIAASTLVGAAGTLEAGRQQQEAYEYNAQVSEQDAKAAEEKAAYDEAAHRVQVRKLLSTQRALYGASGVAIEGTPLLVMADTAKQGELDALAIRYGGDVAAARERNQATLNRMYGENAKKASYYQAGSTLLTGGSRFTSQILRMQPKGQLMVTG